MSDQNTQPFHTFGEILNSPIQSIVMAKPSPLHQNLHIILQQLRSPHERSFFWADAICIDQSNITERSQQVSIMRQIYQQASLVWVYLGDPGDEAQEAVNLGDLILRVSGRLPPGKELSPQEYKNFGLPPSGSSPRSALRHLVTNPWFDRVWTAQEFVVARNVDMVY
jgi:hypothetical protein